MEIAHIIDGSFEGLLTSVFEAYSSRRFPAGICADDGYQLDFGQEQVHIRTDGAKASRVMAGILRKMGAAVYEQAWTAFLSNDATRHIKILRYLALGFQVGRALPDMLAEPAVMDVLELARPVARECNKLLGFVRFSIMENGAQFSEIAPEHNQLPLLMPHFADRLPDVPFVLHDSRRKLAGLHGAGQWRIVVADGLRLPGYSDDELEWRKMWKRYFDALAIEERKNARLQMSLMPKRYWRGLTEMQPAAVGAGRRAALPPESAKPAILQDPSAISL